MRRLFLCTALITALSPIAAQAQGLPPMTDIPAEVDANAIVLGTGGVTDGRDAENWFTFGNDQAIVRNVTEATLTPVLPDPAKATGAGVIVAPGGGFLMLSMDLEGWDIANWLKERGIAAFVLKYRTRPTSPDNETYAEELMALLSGAGGGRGTPEDAIVDAEAALALVRSRASEWGVDPERVGLLGFSAGAIAALQATLRATPETMPSFTAPIYPPMDAVTVPAEAAPLFVALAADDPLFGGKGYALAESWHQAGRPVELHVYQSGGHGFGLGAPGTGAAGWLDDFYGWLELNGMLAASAN